MKALDEIANIHYKGIRDEFKAIGKDAKIDYAHLRNKWEFYDELIFTHKINGCVVGFHTTGKEPMVYVDNEHQRHGIGSILLDEVRPSFVWVMKGNTNAENFYKKNGFIQTDSREVAKFGHKITEIKWVRDAVS